MLSWSLFETKRLFQVKWLMMLLLSVCACANERSTLRRRGFAHKTYKNHILMYFCFFFLHFFSVDSAFLSVGIADDGSVGVDAGDFVNDFDVLMVTMMMLLALIA